MPTIEPRTLETFVASIVKELGADTSDAAAVAESLVSADLCGHHSHGVRLLPSKYQPEIREGKIDPTAEPVLERDGPLTAIVDGQKAFGQVVGRFAIDGAVAKARETGICVAGVRNVSHLGRIGEWTCRAAGSDLVCLAFVANPSSRHVAPAGTAEPRLSTNPISIGIPTFDAFDFPVLLDMATSQIAKGKTRLYDAEDEQLPEECVVTSDGESVIDPSRYLDGQGALLPLGGLTSGHKGFGLATVAELLAANVSDGESPAKAMPSGETRPRSSSSTLLSSLLAGALQSGSRHSTNISNRRPQPNSIREQQFRVTDRFFPVRRSTDSNAASGERVSPYPGRMRRQSPN